VIAGVETTKSGVDLAELVDLADHISQEVGGPSLAGVLGELLNHMLQQLQ
jgi:hypothetical protein